jgi:hypothetical protein
MIRPNASSPSEPSYWSTATGLVTLLSIIAGVLVHRLIPGLVLLALALVFAAIIWRFRTLRYWEVSFRDTARDRWLWISVAGVVVLALLFVGLITNGSNGSDQTVQASPRVAEVTGCMKAHGLSHAFQELPAKDISSRNDLEKPMPGAGLRRSVVMSVSSEADPEGGEGSAWVAGVAA